MSADLKTTKISSFKYLTSFRFRSSRSKSSDKAKKEATPRSIAEADDLSPSEVSYLQKTRNRSNACASKSVSKHRRVSTTWETLTEVFWNGGNIKLRSDCGGKEGDIEVMTDKDAEMAGLYC